MKILSAAQIVAEWPSELPSGARLNDLREAAWKLAKYSADPDGTPTRDALEILNAAINPDARRIILSCLEPRHPSRYHFTDDAPFSVQTAEGEVRLGGGWLAITEAEYASLSTPTDGEKR